MKISKSQAHKLVLELAPLQADFLILDRAIDRQDFEKAVKIIDFLADRIKEIFKKI